MLPIATLPTPAEQLLHRHFGYDDTGHDVALLHQLRRLLSSANSTALLLLHLHHHRLPLHLSYSHRHQLDYSRDPQDYRLLPPLYHRRRHRRWPQLRLSAERVRTVAVAKADAHGSGCGGGGRMASTMVRGVGDDAGHDEEELDGDDDDCAPFQTLVAAAAVAPRCLHHLTSTWTLGSETQDPIRFAPSRPLLLQVQYHQPSRRMKPTVSLPPPADASVVVVGAAAAHPPFLLSSPLRLEPQRFQKTSCLRAAPAFAAAVAVVASPNYHHHHHYRDLQRHSTQYSSHFLLHPHWHQQHQHHSHPRSPSPPSYSPRSTQTTPMSRYQLSSTHHHQHHR
mmetsp:Transcript_15888/g.34380  ORF Transcript_15888/g.34380 Transcript_15888/m.34380 type:complete len:337 (-) Transcript_15888:1335-2345(-)